MLIHDRTRVGGLVFHDFHQDWTIEIRRALNRGLLPPGFFAIAESRVLGWEPYTVTIKVSPPSTPVTGGLAVADSPPRAQQVAKVESELASYARRANRISIQSGEGNVVAIIEVESPGNKDRKVAIELFIRKAVEFLDNRVNLVVIDLFPPSARDPNGIHELIWKELTDDPFEPRPEDKALTGASYDAWDVLTAYVNPVAVGDPLPETPLFLGWRNYINIPLEATYMASWAEIPSHISDRIQALQA